MTDIHTKVAIVEVERELVAAKMEAKDHVRVGRPVPQHLTRRIENLKGAATVLRKRSIGDSA